MYEDPRYLSLSFVCSDRNLRSNHWVKISDRAAGSAGSRISHLHFTEYVLRYISLFVCQLPVVYWSAALGGAVKRQYLQST